MSDEVMRTVDRLTDLLHKLAGPACQEFGLMFGDKAHAYRLRNLLSTTLKAKQKLSDARIAEKAVPARLLLPIVENCSIEDDETLQEKWAGLLATASHRGDSVSPSFIETLKQLTPEEARYLESECMPVVERFAGIYESSDDQIAMPLRLRITLGTVHKLPRRQDVFLETFERLGLVTRDYTIANGAVSPAEAFLDGVNTQIEFEYRFTGYGLRFLWACRGPRASQ